MTGSIRAHAVMRAVQAFFSTLARRPSQRSLLSTRGRIAGIENRCPVCGARFRGARVCSRCGASLEPLMLLSVKSWHLREAARQALDAGNAERALQLSLEAQRIQGTDRGEALRLLCGWLKMADGKK